LRKTQGWGLLGWKPHAKTLKGGPLARFRYLDDRAQSIGLKARKKQKFLDDFVEFCPAVRLIYSDRRPTGPPRRVTGPTSDFLAIPKRLVKLHGAGSPFRVAGAISSTSKASHTGFAATSLRDVSEGVESVPWVFGFVKEVDVGE